MPVAPREIEAAAQMRHRAMDAQQLVAAAQLLALRVDQQQQRPAGKTFDDFEHGACLAQREIDAHRGMVRRADDGDRGAVERRRAAQEVVVGANGCFGGMGIVARCADTIVMSDIARHAMSGPEVIESSHGAGEFDSRDRALVWRTTGGKHRWLTGDCDALVEDDPAAFRAAAIAALDVHRPMTLAALQQESTLLQRRTDVDGENADAFELWTLLGVPDAQAMPDLDADAVRARRPAALAALANGGA